MTQNYQIQKKITDHDHYKYITTPEFNTLSAKIFNVRLAQADLVTKTDFDANLEKNSDRVTSNKSKHLRIENKQKNLKTFDSSYYWGRNYFETQNTLVFQLKPKYIKLLTYGISEWKSRGFSYQSLNAWDPRTKLSKPIRPRYAIFNGGLLYQSKNDATIAGPIVNIYTVYKTSLKTISSSHILKNCLLGTIKITNTTNSDPEKYKYSGYGIGFDRKGQYTYPDGGMGRNAIIFGADLSNSLQSRLLGRDYIQRIDDTTIHAEKMHSLNFTVENKAFCLSLHCNGDDSCLFVNGKEVIKFNAKNSEIKAHSLCLGNISNEYPNASDFEDPELHGNIYDFSLVYSAINNDKILDIHNYLMKKNNIV